MGNISVPHSEWIPRFIQAPEFATLSISSQKRASDVLGQLLAKVDQSWNLEEVLTFCLGLDEPFVDVPPIILFLMVAETEEWMDEGDELAIDIFDVFEDTIPPRVRPSDACPCRSGGKLKQCCKVAPDGPFGPNPRVRQTLFEVIDNQLARGTPAATSLTYTRLTQEGLSSGAAKSRIAGVVLDEMTSIVHDKREFDEAAFAKKLERL